ncbi:hypothetical protein N431DRAFT_550973 [Stipitochalara longipes BDJ]|nr:hypothetical protein N431DRAFT_550973 [Stipitochalara longipes BDJ]
MASLQREYKYEPLPQGNSIRYLILLPGDGDDPLVCSLHAGSIEDVPPFEAISYVWGSKERNHAIFCSLFSIAITANLRDALKGVRWRDKARGHQVALMGQIYQKATKVLIFVGVNAGQHGPAVKSLLADTRKMIQEELESTHFAQDAFPYPAKDDALLTDRRWTSMKVLLRLPWFSRGWVVQEAGLAAEATVIWGDTEFDWLDLMRTHLWVRKRAYEVYRVHHLWLSHLHIMLYQRRHEQEAGAFQHHSYSPSTFHTLLSEARFLNLTDERDKVYAFISLQSDVAIEPNYEAPYLQVYVDFARKYLLTTHDLSLLDEIQQSEDTIASEYPTWVLRWNTNFHPRCWSTNSQLITRPSVSPALPAAFAPGNALKVRAVLFDTIHFRFPLGNQSDVRDNISILWQRLSSLPLGLPFPIRSRGKVFAQTLRDHKYRGIWKTWVAHEAALMLHLQQVRREDWLDAAELAHLEKRAVGGSIDHFVNFIKPRIRNRSFFMTNRGYYGLAPSTICEGDICAVIFGTRAPFALRTTEKEDCYKVLGNASITSKDSGWRDGDQFFRSLGAEKARDWIELGLSEEDIFLV